MISDLGDSIKATLNIGLSADKNSIPDLERLRVLETDTAAYSNAVAELPAIALQIARRMRLSSSPSPLAKREYCSRSLAGSYISRRCVDKSVSNTGSTLHSCLPWTAGTMRTPRSGSKSTGACSKLSSFMRSNLWNSLGNRCNGKSLPLTARPKKRAYANSHPRACVANPMFSR